MMTRWVESWRDKHIRIHVYIHTCKYALRRKAFLFIGGRGSCLASLTNAAYLGSYPSTGSASTLAVFTAHASLNGDPNGERTPGKRVSHHYFSLSN